MAGEFNDLRQVGVTLAIGVGGASAFSLFLVCQVSPDQWKVIEAMIRKTKGS